MELPNKLAAEFNAEFAAVFGNSELTEFKAPGITPLVAAFTPGISPC